MTVTSENWVRSEEHTSELQSRRDLVCRLLLEKKTQIGIINQSDMAPDKSLAAVVLCAVAVRGTIVGPLIGAICVNRLHSLSSFFYNDRWPTNLALFSIPTVLLL